MEVEKSHPIKSSLARLYAPNGTIVGAGFLVTSRHLLTCSHVITQALGFHSEDLPVNSISLDFPFVAPEKLNARVIIWRPDDYDDIAGLEISKPLPSGVQPAQLVDSAYFWEHSFQCCGFPSGTGYEDGIWTRGIVLERNARGLLQLESHGQVGYPLSKGFSGAPIWDIEIRGIIGMVVGTDATESRRSAFAIPVRRIYEMWPELLDVEHIYMPTPTGMTNVVFKISLVKPLSEKDIKTIHSLILSLAKELNYSPTEFRLMDIQLSSVILTVQMPNSAAQKLLERYRTNDPLIRSLGIADLGIDSANDVDKDRIVHEEIKYLESLIRQRNNELEAANKELEAFSYSVSHDLRAPLRSIDGFSNVLLEDYSEQLPEEGRQYLKRIRSAALRMSTLIDDLLNLSRVTRTAVQPRSINLSKMATEIAQELQQSQPERQATFSITPDLMVEADPRLMQIVLENLLSNAWKFTSKRDQSVIEFGQLDRGKERTFYVRDNGVGFDMAYADKLFGVFQRLHSVNEFPGTGVGLATVQRIISTHGGRTWAESKQGVGSTFYFTLD
jgi:signal transduction histidine kinase